MEKEGARAFSLRPVNPSPGSRRLEYDGGLVSGVGSYKEDDGCSTEDVLNDGLLCSFGCLEKRLLSRLPRSVVIGPTSSDGALGLLILSILVVSHAGT